MGLAQPVQKLSEAEYLQIERQAQWKSEYFEGEMFAMAGGSFNHGLIAANLISQLSRKLAKRGCSVVGSDVRVKAADTTLYTYPDVTVACGKLEFVDAQQDTLLNPTIIIEVLSDSTEAQDRGYKFENCRRIPSLQEYILVSQKAAKVEQFIRRPAGQWLFREAEGLEVALTFPSLKISIPLAGIFARVQFNQLVLPPAKP